MFRPPVGMMPAYRPPKITNNLCETHFPEPIMYHFERPLCRKCIPEYIK